MVTDEAFTNALRRIKKLETDLERTKTVEVPLASGGGSILAPTARGDMLAANAIPRWVILPLGGVAGAILSRTTDPTWTNILTIGFATSRVGIGIVNPTTKLDIVGSENNTELRILANAAQSVGNPIIKVCDSAAAELFRINSNDNTNLFIGYRAGNATAGGSNTFVGSNAGLLNTTGDSNVIVGTNSFRDNLIGFSNVAMGVEALISSITGTNNVAIGWHSMQGALCAADNVAVGPASLAALHANGYNVAIGEEALVALDPTYQAIIGFADYGGTVPGTVQVTSPGHGFPAGVTTGVAISSVLYGGVYSITFIDVDHFYFTAVWAGNESNCFWYIDREAKANTAVGTDAGAVVITGGYNVFLGHFAGNHVSQKIDAVNSIAIGFNAYTTKDNQIVLGNGNVIETLLNGQTIITGVGDRLQFLAMGYTTQTEPVGKFLRNDGNTSAVANVLNIGANSTGVPAAGFGAALLFTLASDSNPDITAGTLDARWTDATDGATVSRMQMETTGQGHCAMWSFYGVDSTARTIIADAGGDVTEVITILYSIAEISGADVGGGVCVLEPGDSFNLIDDGTDIVTITCGAAGDLTIVQSAGTDTYWVSLWLNWI